MSRSRKTSFAVPEESKRKYKEEEKSPVADTDEHRILRGDLSLSKLRELRESNPALRSSLKVGSIFENLEKIDSSTEEEKNTTQAVEHIARLKH